NPVAGVRTDSPGDRELDEIVIDHASLCVPRHGQCGDDQRCTHAHQQPAVRVLEYDAMSTTAILEDESVRVGFGDERADTCTDQQDTHHDLRVAPAASCCERGEQPCDPEPEGDEGREPPPTDWYGGSIHPVRPPVDAGQRPQTEDDQHRRSNGGDYPEHDA